MYVCWIVVLNMYVQIETKCIVYTLQKADKTT